MQLHGEATVAAPIGRWELEWLVSKDRKWMYVGEKKVEPGNGVHKLCKENSSRSIGRTRLPQDLPSNLI